MDATASNMCMELLRGMTTTAILTYLDTSNVLMLHTTVTLSLWSTFALLIACDIKCKLFEIYTEKLRRRCWQDLLPGFWTFCTVNSATVSDTHSCIPSPGAVIVATSNYYPL